MPSRPETPQTPSTPKSASSEKRKTLSKRMSLKDLFSASKTDNRKSLRKSQSKPELRAGNRLVDDDAPPVPALPSVLPDFTAPKENKQVVHDTLAALTANSKGSTAPSIPPPTITSGPAPAVEMVPDVFAAFNSSQTSLQLRGVTGQLNGISAPSNPQRTSSQSPFANFEYTTDFNISQQSLNSMANANGSQPNLRSKPQQPQLPAAAPPKETKPLQPSKTAADKDEEAPSRKRTKSLSKRLSISALFARKKKDAEPVPDMPSMPLSYTLASKSQAPQLPPHRNGMPRSASAQEIATPPRAISPMVAASGSPSKERPVTMSAKPVRAPTTARVPVPRIEKEAQASTTTPGVGLDKPMPAPPTATAKPEKPSSTVRKVPDPSISKQAPLPPALAATAARLCGDSPPTVSAPTLPSDTDSPKTDDGIQKRQSRREQSVVPSSSSEYLKQQKDAIANHQQAQQALVQQFRSVSEPLPASGPPRSASEQSFQRAANPFAEQAPSAEVIQQAAALVRKPAPMQVVQKAEAAYIHQRQQQMEKMEKLDEKPTPTGWTTFDDEPKPIRTAPLKISKKSSISSSLKETATAPLRIEKKSKSESQSVQETAAEKTHAAPVVAAVAAATGAASVAAAAVAKKPATDAPSQSSAPTYTENPTFSFPPKPKKEAGASTLIQPPPRKIRRVSVPPLQPESLNSPHAAIPSIVPSAGAPISDPAAAAAPPGPATPAKQVTKSAPAPDLSAANAKLEAEPMLAPAINIITATPQRSPAQSTEGPYEASESSDHGDIASPVPSEGSTAIVTKAVRTSIAWTTTPVITSAAETVQPQPDAAATANAIEAGGDAASPTDSDYSLPTLESPTPMPVISEAQSFASGGTTPTEESITPTASSTPTKSSGAPASLLAGGSAAVAAVAAATAAAATAIMGERKPKVESDSEDDMTSVEHHLAYLEGSSAETHSTTTSETQLPAITPVKAGVLTLAPITDKVVDVPVATVKNDAPGVASAKNETPGVQDSFPKEDIQVEAAEAKEPEAPVVAIPAVNGATPSPASDDETDSPDTVKAESVVGEQEAQQRSESAPPNALEEKDAVMPGSLSQTLPTRLSVSPVAAAEGRVAKDDSASAQGQRASSTSIFALAASAASSVRSAVSSAFLEASEALDDLDAKIEQTVRSASPNLAAIALPAVGVAAATGAAASASASVSTSASSSAHTATVVQTGSGRPAPLRQGSTFSQRRGSVSSDGASIYTTPMTDFDGEYFDSPSASTTSFETASSNATISPPAGAHALLPTYSNSARPPSVAKLDDLPPILIPPPQQRRGSMPAALAGTAARRRTASSPVDGSVPQLPPAPPMPTALGMHTRSSSRQAMRSATMPVSTREIADGDAVLTPPVLPSVDGHSSEESSSFHLDTDTIHDSPVEDFGSPPDSPLGLHMPGNASSMYVVPFSPEMEEVLAMSGAAPRTHTSENYSTVSGAREHARRASGGLRNVFNSAIGFARGPSSQEPVVSEARVRSSQPQRIQPESRNSVNTVVDYSSPTASKRNSTVGGNSNVGLGMFDASPATIGEVEEIDETKGGEQGFFHGRRRIDDPDSSIDSASYSSSGSDDHEGSPRTPRTPDLEALVQSSVMPNTGLGLGIMGMPGTPSPSELKKGAASGTMTRTRAPFRALHYDISAEGETETEETITTHTNTTSTNNSNTTPTPTASVHAA